MLRSRRLYILCWSEFSRRRLLPAVSPAAGHLTTPTVAGLPGLCENFCPTTSKGSPILRLLSSHWATSVVRTRVVGVANVGDSLRRLSSLQHRIYNLLGPSHHAAASRGCGGFAAVGRRYRSIAARSALSSECGQFHVVSWRRKLNTDLLTSKYPPLRAKTRPLPGPKKLWNFEARACIGRQKNLDFINKNVRLVIRTPFQKLRYYFCCINVLKNTLMFYCNS